MKYNFKTIEKKWQKKWEEKEVFEPEIDKRKKFFVTFPYPYLNGYMHIGHFFSLMRVESFARYKRLRGFNVLFPQGWHATGSPLISAARRVREKEPKQLKIMKDMGIKDSEIKKFGKAEYWLKFFAPEFKKDYKSMGISVDWRREFHTTSLNPYYDKFIQWQFKKLKDKGYCIKGRFPVVWDPKENVAVGDHARVEGEGVTTQDFIWGKFRMKDSDLILMAGTTRPDAFYGQTHLWIDPNATYKIVKVKDEKWVVGPEAVKKIEHQYTKPKVIGEISAKELMGKWVRGPLVDYDTYIVPAWFIDANIGSGIVYSALEDPVDLFELERIHKDMNLIKQYNLDEKVIAKLKPISIIKVSGMGNNLGAEIGKEFSVKSPDDKKNIELAKGELNRRVFRKGVMKNNCGACSGMSVQDTQKYLKKHLVEKGDAVMFYELTGKVVSRGLNECVVKIVDDQWFLDYANEKWKQKTKECLKNLKLYPEKSRQQFEYTISWLHEWACTREEGLGTKLPWDKKWLIESLSDSTIYMAYYTIAHLIKEIDISKINDSFFDYIFLGKGAKPKVKNVDKIKREFEYWYPLDFRNSGKDLIQNHLTFFMFNHVAIFSKKYWPKGIAVNGFVTVDGRKMAKSLGNMIPVREMAKKFGADASRLTILSGGEGLDDPNWDTNLAITLNSKFNNIYDTIFNVSSVNKKTEADELILSRLNKIVKETTLLMDETMFRSAIQKVFFEYWSLIKDYLNRTSNKPNKKIFEELIQKFLIMLHPFCPHITEELWEKLGHKNFISLEKWPVADEKKINEKLEKQEQAIDKLVSDINHIKGLVKKKVSETFVYVLPKEKEIYEKVSNLISKRIGLKVKIQAVNDKDKYDPENKSKKIKPGRPGIYLK